MGRKVAQNADPICLRAPSVRPASAARGEIETASREGTGEKRQSVGAMRSRVVHQNAGPVCLRAPSICPASTARGEIERASRGRGTKGGGRGQSVEVRLIEKVRASERQSDFPI
jgi:hypothetical protein